MHPTSTFQSYADDLEKQREYVKKIQARGGDFPLIAAESFVRGMRDSGYKNTGTAIDEFIDNSIQAQATKVDIVIGYGPKNATMKKLDVDAGGLIAIVDNGHGMDPEMIRLAVVWGGTHRPNDRAGLGRYGFGLPSAAVSISRSFEVYSKVDGGEWWKVRVDVDEIASGRAGSKAGMVVVPKASKAALPPFVTTAIGGDLAHGTVVLLDQPDQLTNGFVQTQAFRQNILEHVGLIFRNFIPDVGMRLVEVGKKVDAVSIEPIDPLFLTPTARFFDETPVRAMALPEANFAVRTEKGREGAVRVRYSHMPFAFMSKKTVRHKVRAKNTGIIVLRGGRQIDVLQRLPDTWHFPLQSNARYYGCEVDFDPTLDEEFGVTTNKQQINPSESMWDVLKDNGVLAALKDLKARYDSSEREESTREKGDESKESEDIAAKSEKFRKRKAIPPTPKRVKESQAALEAEVKKVQAETGKNADEIVDEIEASPFKVFFEERAEGTFFRMLQVGGQKRLLINTGHRFYTDLYNSPFTSNRVRTALECLLIVLGECELDATEDREEFYQDERVEWSRRINIMLKELDARNPLADAREARAEAEADSQSAM